MKSILNKLNLLVLGIVLLLAFPTETHGSPPLN